MESLTEIHTVENKNCIFVEKEFMVKTIAIGDKLETLDAICQIVETYCPNVRIETRARSIKEGVGAINEGDPDLVIIDTKLSDGSGFDLIRHFNKPDFKIIFFSSSMVYALTAIKFNAVDYLLKPIDEEELTLAVNKAVDMIRFEENLQLKALGKSLMNLNNSHRLILKTSDQVHVVNIKDIIRIEADSNYSTFHMMDGREILVSKALKVYEEQLLEHGFHRIHKSHLFNIHKISHLDKADGGFVVMIDGARIPIASRKRDMLLKLLEEME